MLASVAPHSIVSGERCFALWDGERSQPPSDGEEWTGGGLRLFLLR